MNVPSLTPYLNKIRGLAIGLLAVLFLQAGAMRLFAQAPSRAHATDLLKAQPLWFEPTSDNAEMVSRFEHRSFRIQQSGTVRIAAPVAGHADEVVLSLAGANTAVPITGGQRLPGESNYFLGKDAATWRHRVAHFAQAKLNDVYPGIDLTYYGNGESLEYDYAVAPGSDAGAIRLQVNRSARLDERTGDLLVAESDAATELLRLHRPVAYQIQQDGSHRLVAASYVKNGDASFGFALGAYDHAQPLIVDPVITYSSYFGGSGLDEINDIKTDAAGNIYLLVETNSSDLPVTKQITGACASGCGPGNPSYAMGSLYNKDMYVAKLDPTGKTLLFSTYLGGSADDVAGSFALGSDGAIYIAGETTSSDFPLVNQYSSLPVTNYDGTLSYSSTLTKLSADGSTILYSSLLGGGLVKKGEGCCVVDQNSAQPGSIAVGANGIAYMIGLAVTDNQNYGFGNFRDQKGGGSFTAGDGSYLAKFDTTKSGGDSLLFAVPYGTTGDREGIMLTAIALDSKGNVWAIGNGNFYAYYPATPDAYQPVCDAGDPNNCDNVLILEINPDGGVIYATYFGGTTSVYGGPGEETATDIVLDPSDNIYISGGTNSSDFPLKNAASTSPNDRPFLSKFAPGGKSLLYSTYADAGNPLVTVTPAGVAALVGSAFGSGSPVVNGTANPNLYNATDTYYQVYDTTQSGVASLLTASYLGATANTVPQATTFDAQGNLWFAGYTIANTLPVVTPYQGICVGGCFYNGESNPDGYFTRIQLSAGGAVALVPTTQSFPNTAVGATSAAMTSTLTNTTTAAFAFTPSFTDSADFKETDTCSGMLAAGASCVFSFTFSPQSAASLTSTFTLTGTATPSTTLPVTLSGTGTGAPVLTLTPSTYAFGSVASGSNPVMQTLVLKNNGNVADNAFTFNFSESDQGSQTPSFAYTDNCTSLAVGATCNIVITFTPHAGVTATGTLTVTGDAGVAPVVATITGTGTAAAAATLSTTSFSFGSLTDGTTTPATTFTLNNTGGSSLTVSSLTITGAGAAAFDIVPGSNCTTAFAANASCTFQVTFAPTAVASYAATVNIVDQAGTQTLSLTGIGTAAPSPTLSPSSFNFGNVTAGATTPYTTITITNPSSVALTGGAVTGAGDKDFTLNQGSVCGAPIAPGGSCTYQVAFVAPATPGTYSEAISFTFASGAVVTEAVTGTSVAAPSPTLSPSSYNFGTITAGATSPSVTVTITNPSSVALTGGAVTGAGDKDFTLNQGSVCGAPIAPGGSCTYQVAFVAPATPGTYSEAISFTFANGAVVTEAVTGTSVAPAISFTPSSFAFGSVAVGSNKSETFTLANATNASVNITGYTSTGDFGADFIFSGSCGAPQIAILAPGTSCSVVITFIPSVAASYSASFSLLTSAGPQTVAFTGQGTGAGSDFTIAATPASQTVTAGSVAVYTLTVTPAGSAFTQPITLSATGLPTGATVQFFSSPVTPGSAPAIILMDVLTATPKAEHTNLPLWPLTAPISAGILLLLPRVRRRRMLPSLFGVLLLMGISISLMGCGVISTYNGSGGTPSTITVTATSGAIQHTTTVTLNMK